MTPRVKRCLRPREAGAPWERGQNVLHGWLHLNRASQTLALLCFLQSLVGISHCLAIRIKEQLADFPELVKYITS